MVALRFTRIHGFIAAVALLAIGLAVLVASSDGAERREEVVNPVAEPSPRPTPTETVVPPPNIVVIVMDDLRTDQLTFMPETEALFVGHGTVFSDSIVSFPECCPSRATLLTGQYAHNHGVLSGDLPSGGVTRFPADDSLAVWLDDAGYETYLVGKYLNGYGEQAEPDIPPGWEHWFALIDPTTTWWYDYEVFADGEVVRHGDAPSEHRTTVLGERVLADLDDAISGDSPFFIWYAPVAPHIGFLDDEQVGKGTGVAGPGGIPSLLQDAAGWFAPDEYRGLLDDHPWERPVSFNEADRSDKPDPIAAASELGPGEDQAVAEAWRRSAETVMAVDDIIGQIGERLAESGVIENTVLVFTSDNGFMFGEHRLVYLKYWPYEESIRVPLMIRGPGFPSRTVSSPVSHIDVAPTLAAVAGASPTITPDGEDLGALALDPALHAQRPLLLETGPLFGRLVYNGVRVPGFKYVVYRDGHRELYDLTLDPHELESRAGVADYAEVEERLENLRRRLASCRGETCRTIDATAQTPPMLVVDPVGVVAPGEVFFLNAAGSFDPDGGALSRITWQQTGGSETILYGRENGLLAGIAPDIPGELVLRVTVIDDEGQAVEGEVTVPVQPHDDA